MRSFLTLLAIAALAAFAANRPKPKPPTGPFTLHAEALTKLWAIWSVSATGGPDSLVVIVKSTGATTDVRRRYNSGALKTDSVDVGYPAPGATKVVTALAIAFKFGQSSDTVSLGSASVTGDIPNPSGTFKTTPASALLRPGQRIPLVASGS